MSAIYDEQMMLAMSRSMESAREEAEMEMVMAMSKVAIREEVRMIEGLKVKKMSGEGYHCLFRALSYHLYGDDKHYQMMRNKCVEHMRNNRGLYSMVPEQGHTFSQYLQSMANGDAFGIFAMGGDPEIGVVSQLFDRQICVYREYNGRLVKQSGSSNTGLDRPELKLLWSGAHYDVLE